jgi:hypothetical protein
VIRANQIFISYRRDDSAGVTGRIYDRLVYRYGRKGIFKDVDSIPPGVNFKDYVDSVIQDCDVVKRKTAPPAPNS